MDAGIRSALTCAMRDGKINKAEVADLTKAALDGRGITKNEAKDLKEVRDQYGDQMTSHARKSMDNVLGHMNRSWSRTKKVHLPNVDDDGLKDLMNNDPRFHTRSGDRVGGGESGGSSRRVARRPARRVGGGESGGSSRANNPPPVSSGRVGGGE